jgi:hypothetical protein
VADLVDSAIACGKKDPRFAYIAPTYQQAKDVVWSYLKDYALKVPGTNPNEGELRVDFPNGARIRLYGAESYERLRGLYLDGCVIDEAGDIDPRAWAEVIRPALSDRQGWAVFIGTPKGQNAFYRICQRAKVEDDWYFTELRASATGIISEHELASARREMTAEQYEQEYECSFLAAIKGAYYGRDIDAAEQDGRITGVPYDKAGKVFAAVDLGISDNMAIWVGQPIGRERHLIDYYENSGFGLDHYVDWLNQRPYRIDGLIVPHDAEARELQTGKTRTQFFRERGFEVIVLPQSSVEDGINSVRLSLSTCWFDAKKTERGLECLRNYQSEFDEKRDVLRPRPLHNWASHGADAFRYWTLGVEFDEPKRVKEPEWVGYSEGGGWMG